VPLDNDTTKEHTSGRILFARDSVLFTLVAAVLAAGLALFAIPATVKSLDILWIFSLSLTAAIFLISLLAKNIADLKGFELMVAAATLLRMSLNVNSAILIFLHRQGGVVIDTFGKVICASGSFWIALISLLVTAVAVILILAAAKRITNLSSAFDSEIMPIKQAGIEADLASKTITSQQAALLNKSVDKESLFYLNMAGLAKLFRLDTAIAALLIGFSIISQTMFASTDITGHDTAIQNTADLAGGTATLALAPAMIIAMASAYLLAKASQSVSAEEKKDLIPPRKTIEVITNTGEIEEVEVLNPEFADLAEDGDTAAAQTENIANFEPVTNPQETSPDESNIIPVGHKFKSIDDYYDDIAEHIAQLDSKEMPVLLAAESIELLPVTVAVNVAVRISKSDRKTLLIDADPARNAVAKAFDIDAENITESGQDTCIDNLSVWTDAKLDTLDAEKLNDKIGPLKNRYEKIIIYAPNMTSPHHAIILTNTAQRGVVFFSGDIDHSKVYQLLLTSPCKPIAVMLSPKEAI